MSEMPMNLKYLRKNAGFTQSDLAGLLGIDTTNYNRLERGKTELTYSRMQQLARILNCDPVDLISDGSPELTSARNPLRRVTVKGYVQAGYWSESTEWDTGDFYDVAVPNDTEFARLTLHAAETRGPSMNRKYAEGTVLVFLDNIEAEEQPQFGKRYIVERTGPDGLREATVKTLWQDDEGKIWLLPDSDDPRHQAPIEINGGEGDTIRLVGRVVYSVARE